MRPLRLTELADFTIISFSQLCITCTQRFVISMLALLHQAATALLNSSLICLVKRLIPEAVSTVYSLVSTDEDVEVLTRMVVVDGCTCSWLCSWNRLCTPVMNRAIQTLACLCCGGVMM